MGKSGSSQIKTSEFGFYSVFFKNFTPNIRFLEETVVVRAQPRYLCIYFR